MKSLVYKLLFLSVFIMGFTSCDDREDTEFNLPGEWYTSDEIDFGIYTWGRGTVMTLMNVIKVLLVQREILISYCSDGNGWIIPIM